MKGLILKDLYITKNNSRFYLLFLGLFGIVSLTQGDGGMSFLPFCVILCSVLVVSSLSYDELSKWDRLALCMPITRRQVVASKYLLHLIFTAVGVLLGLGIGVLSLLIHDGGDYMALLTLVATSAAIALTYGALVLPLIFRYGPEKGRILLILLALVPAALVGTGASIGNGAPSAELISRLVYFAPAAALALFGISYPISVKIYEKKQF